MVCCALTYFRAPVSHSLTLPSKQNLMYYHTSSSEYSPPFSSLPTTMFAMTTYAFLYEYDPSSPKIAEHRPRHREFCAELKKRRCSYWFWTIYRWQWWSTARHLFARICNYRRRPGTHGQRPLLLRRGYLKANGSHMESSVKRFWCLKFQSK